MAEAQKYIDANATLKPAILNLSLGKDTSLIEKRLLRQAQGDVFSVGYVTYKVMEAKETVQYRSNYIFLMAALYPNRRGQLKKLIVDQQCRNTVWNVIDKYTMDGNIPAEIPDGFLVKKCYQRISGRGWKTSSVTSFCRCRWKQWHYIVKKTHEDQRKKEIVVLRSNGRWSFSIEIWVCQAGFTGLPDPFYFSQVVACYPKFVRV